MRKVRYPTILLVSFFSLLRGFCQERAVTLQLKWWHQFQFAGYYAAEKQGFYARAGLKVNIRPGDAAHASVTEVMAGFADFGVTGSDLLMEYARGKPLVALGAIFQHSPYVILSLKQSNIKSPSDLINKTIMGAENQGWVELKAMFLSEGIDPRKIAVMNHSWNNNDLVKGNVAAMTGYRSVEPFQLAQLGANVSSIEPVTYGIDFYGDILFSTKQFIADHPRLVEDFRQASFRGWEYAISHKEEICDYILTLPGVKERKVTKEALLFEANEMEKLILPQVVEIGHMNEGRWAHILSTHQRLGLVSSQTVLDDFLYRKKRPLADALKDIGILLLGGVGGLFLIVLIYGIVVQQAVNRKTREQRMAMLALKNSEEKYRTLIQQASDGIVICDPLLQFIQANTAALLLLGYTEEEFLHLRLTDLIIRKDTEEPLALFDGLREQEALFSEGMARRKDGSAFIMEIHSSRMSNGNYLGFIRDITERKNQEAENEKRAKEREQLISELSNTNWELKQFSYIISHNLRAPVTNLLALTRLIDRKKIKDEETWQLISSFSKSAVELNETLDDLIRILIIKENGNVATTMVHFSHVLDKITASVQLLVSNSHTVIRSDFSACDEIVYNHVYLESIFLNLITNSIRYAQPGRNPEITIRSEWRNGKCYLVFEDNGRGFDIKKIGNRLFGFYQRFHQHVGSRGIGLYLIHSQITSLGGTIEAESEVGKGTRFTICLGAK